MSNEPNNSKSEDIQFTAERAGDFMMNALLRDMLKRNSPPDFQQRILARLNARNLGIEEAAPLSRRRRLFSNDELDEALGAAQADVEFAHAADDETPAVVPKKRRARPVPQVLKVHPRIWDYRSVRRGASWGTFAASLLLLAYVGSQFINGWQTGSENGQDLIASNPVAPVDPSQPELVETIPDGSATSPSLPSVDEPEARGDSTLADSTPVVPPVETAPELRVIVELPQPDALSRQELVSIVDSQFDRIWQQGGLKITPNLSDQAWLSRVTQLAVGREATAAEQEAFRSDRSSDREANVITKLTESNEFALNWGRLLAGHYLRTSIPTVRNQPLAIREFAVWLQNGIQANKSIQSLEAMLATDAIRQGDSSANLWLSETMNREILSVSDRSRNSRLPYRYSSVEAPLVGATTTLLHRSGIASAGCVQCHAQDSNAVAWLPSESAVTREQFWGMAASIAKEAKRRKLPVEVAEDFYYEETDGKVAIATPMLPIRVGGLDTQIDFANWIEQSTEARKGVVEFLWRSTYFQPLVPEFGLEVAEASAERSDLKKLLTRQLQATGNVRELVAVMLSTRGMRTQDASVTESWYLKAKDDVLAQYHTRSRLFTFVPTPARKEDLTRVPTGQQIVMWLDGNGGRGGVTNLAQPDTRRPTRGSRRPEAPKKIEGSQLLYLMSIAKPYSGMTEFANRLSSSQLDWNDQVSHTYLLLEGRLPSSRELSDAKRIYDHNGQDSKKSLIQIGTGHFGSY